MEISSRKLKRDEKVALEARQLFQFFTEAERNNQHFTYKQIREHFPRKALTRHARNFWSWFLHNERQVKGTEYTFSCKGLLDYPEAYFIAAHKHNQGQYFAHFAKAMSDARERADAAREEKKKALELQLPLPEVFEADVPGQQAPQEIHTENIAIDEEETVSEEESDLFDEEDEEESEDTQEQTEAEDKKTLVQITQTPTMLDYLGVYLEPREQREENAISNPKPKETQELQHEPGDELLNEAERSHPTDLEQESLSNNPELSDDGEQPVLLVNEGEHPDLDEPEQASSSDNPDSSHDGEQPALPINLQPTNSGEGIRVLLIIGVVLLILIVLAVIIWLINKWRG